MSTHTGWTGVDLDGTLAHYDGWKGVEHIGEPIAPMVSRVKGWISEGKDVRIFTARVSGRHDLTPFATKEAIEEQDRIQTIIQEWCEKHLGQILPVTCVKDMQMVELWDDRARGVLHNKGIELHSLIAYHFIRILEACGYNVADGLEYGPVADHACAKIKRLVKNCEDALAHVDSAADALTYMKVEDAHNKGLLHQAQSSLTKGLAAMKQVAKE